MKPPKPATPVICLLLLSHSETTQTQLPVEAERLEQSRLVTCATMYGVGFANIFDTYLSPQEYTGVDLRVSRESMRMTRWMDGKLSLQSFFQADLGYTHNKVDNNNTLSALANWNYGLHYNIPATGSFKLLAGGLAGLNGGFVYNPRNTNNPASTRVYISLDASGVAVWDLRVKNYPLILRYQTSLSLIGVMFSPHYSQSYYGILSLENSSGVAEFTLLHNQPSLWQMLTVDFPIGRTKVRFAYIWNAQQPNANTIKTHTYPYIFMMGFVREVCLLENKKGRRQSDKTINQEIVR